MNAKKAQEYFSLYFEGELTGGLLEQFERTLKTDAQVQAEFRAFTQAMQSLEGLKVPIADPEFDLHEAISQRLDKHLYEVDRKPVNQFWTSWRKLAVGGIAVLAVVGAFASIWNRGKSHEANPFPIPGASKVDKRTRTSFDMTRMELLLVENTWTLNYRASEPETITISSEGTPEKVGHLAINDTLESPLRNSGTESILMAVRSNRVQNSAYIALPSESQARLRNEGTGTLGQFATVLSATFGKPVVVIAKESEATFSWTLGKISDVASITEIVKAFGYSVEQKENGVIWIL
jgi:hypothetical protein